MLFAKVWLLGEGETEYWVTQYAAKALEIDLDLAGIRFVPYQNCGIKTLLKVANDLGISWTVLADNDGQGQQDVASAKSFLNGKLEAEHIIALPEGMNIEQYFISEGHTSKYEAGVRSSELQNIVEFKGMPEYPKKLAKLVPDKKKIPITMAIGEGWCSGENVPSVIARAINQARKLGKT